MSADNAENANISGALTFKLRLGPSSSSCSLGWSLRLFLLPSRNIFPTVFTMSQTAVDLNPLLSLTPVRRTRRICPSSDPVKPHRRVPPRRPMSAQTSREYTSDKNATVSGSLTFAEFDYWSEEEQCFVELEWHHQEALSSFLQAHYDVVDMETRGAYLILRCSPEAAQPEARPFTVASRVAVWLDDGTEAPSDMLPGDFAVSDPMEISAEIADDLTRYQPPRDETLLALADKYFPDAESLTYLNSELIVELPKCNESEFAFKLEGLPLGFVNSNLLLRFNNGPLLQTEMKPLKMPKPAELEGEYDDTDYIAATGNFQPGAILSSGVGQISAGVFVEKDNRIRLTVAYHCWSHEDSKNLGKLDSFKVTQGPLDVGTPVGNVVARIGQTDIGLAKIDETISFSNRFMDAGTVAKSFLKSTEVKYGDLFVIDPFVTGVQTVSSVGVRVRTNKARETDSLLPKDTDLKIVDLPPAGKYNVIRQGVYATSKPKLRSQLMIREGVCGSALIRSKRSSARGTVSSLGLGEIAGFMHYADLNLKISDGGQLHCYCDSVDELIQDGWSVYQMGEKRKDGRTKDKTETTLPAKKSRTE